MAIYINTNTKKSIYRQIIDQVERGVRDGSLKPGDQLPSMNVLADRYGISRETVKKAYGILVEKDFIEPRHGKGFYVKDHEKAHSRGAILVIFDKFSVYKQIAFDAFAANLPAGTEITILTHNQNPDLLEYFLDTHLDDYDYYVIAPHFPTDPPTQNRVIKLLEKIPVRKLLLIDHLQPGMSGNFGSVYQDFENDICDGLRAEYLNSGAKRLRVITLPMSMYGDRIRRGVERFRDEYNVTVNFLNKIPSEIEPGDAFLILNSQLDAGLVELSKRIQESGLEIGKGVFIISYNEYPMNELILGGLTTASTDFPEMGKRAAEMICSKKMSKVHNPFRIIRRRTF